MDVLKIELEEAFAWQRFDLNQYDNQAVKECCMLLQSLTNVNNGCAVLTDLALNQSYISFGSLGAILGLTENDLAQNHILSLDEDCIYNRIHPEDLVDKRILELKFFQFLCQQPIHQRLMYRSSCRIRMKNKQGEYQHIANQTTILRNDSIGNMWLALCQYEIATDQSPQTGINSLITNHQTGQTIPIQLSEEREAILSKREKQILLLIKEGLLSKEISQNLGISIHTVNRHRQNILLKLDVNNAQEAIRTAEIMKLM